MRPPFAVQQPSKMAVPFAALQPKHLSVDQWKMVVLIAGIGTVLEYFDFYCYTQLSAVLGKVRSWPR